MKLIKFFSALTIFMGLPIFCSPAEVIISEKESFIEKDTSLYISPFREKNERCFKCHGQDRYQYANETLGSEVKALMFTEMIIDRDKFYKSNHKSFSCTDCHSADYTKFPHPGELRMEMNYNCLDCHGGDEKFAKFKFEEIDTEYHKSVHFKLEDEGFTCWSCHNPHEYKISVRDSRNLKEAILYDNNICLNCHSNYNRFQLLSDKDEVNIMKQHDWLPDQAAHFKNVRCIECHSVVNDSVLVSHQIMPKNKAVRKCNECHSENSLLMSSLYRFQSRKQRRDGFFNGIILNQSYVIGANRNGYLNMLSLIMFSIALIVIITHISFRIFKK
jgi:Zn finger protein HypA/HybF involved in hydrogenase expression